MTKNVQLIFPNNFLQIFFSRTLIVKNETAAFIAAKRNHVRALEYFKSKGDDINTANIDGVTPLDIALIKENTDCIEFLQKHGARENKVRHCWNKNYLG